MNKRIIAGLTLGLGIVATVGVGSYLRMPKNDINTGHKDVFRTSMQLPIETADPARYSSLDTSNVISATGVGLYTTDASGKSVPAMAAHNPVVSHHGRDYTFKLQSDYRWSDGSHVTAADYVYAWQRAVDPRSHARNASRLDIFENAAEIRNGTMSPQKLAVSAPDDYTLRFKLTAPEPYIKDYLAATIFQPVNHTFGQREGYAYGSSSSKVLNNGPYVLADWHGPSDKQWVLKRNRYYPKRSTIKMRQIRFKVMNHKEALAKYQDHQLDTAMLTPAELPRFKGNRDLHSIRTESSAYLFFNMRSGPTANVYVRRAIATGYDKRLLTLSKIADGSEPLNGLIPSGLVHTARGEDYRTVTGELMRYDPDYAGKQWAIAQKELGHQKITLTLNIADNPVAITTAKFMKGQLEHNLPGLTLNVNKTSLQQRIQLETTNKFQIVFATWTPFGGDPVSYLKFAQSANVQNVSGYNNSTYDKYYAEIAMKYAGQPAKRLPLIQRAERMVVSQDAPFAPVMQLGTSYLMRPGLGTLPIQPNGAINYTAIKP